MTPTPRTDDHAQIAFPSGGGVRFIKGTQEEPGYLVSTDFARTLERENAELRTDGQRWQNEHLRLLAENAELRKDKARLKSVLILANMALDTADAHLFSHEGNDLACQEIEAARAAIDAAMEAKP